MCPGVRAAPSLYGEEWGRRDGDEPSLRPNGAWKGNAELRRDTSAASPAKQTLSWFLNEREEENEATRLDRNYNEILQELRVAEAGVQILFAFLLALAFTQRFARITSFERGVYFASLLLSAAAGGLLMAPTAMHRIMFRRGLKDVLVDVAGKMGACWGYRSRLRYIRFSVVDKRCAVWPHNGMGDHSRGGTLVGLLMVSPTLAD